MTNYRAIYDHITTTHPGYGAAERSPGFRNALMLHERIRACRGPTLDVGCGVGFVVELLSQPDFGFEAWGCDVSRVALDRAKERLAASWHADESRLRQVEDGRLPFADGQFGLVTCFDMLEHLDEADVTPMRDELRRVLAPGGTLLVSVSCRQAGSADQFGDNLHRTIRPAAWWLALLEPDEMTVRSADSDAVLWWRKTG
ncbi:MAG: class I SAM-dependent methyltransferase [Phycisphaerales bacterium JB039]